MMRALVIASMFALAANAAQAATLYIDCQRYESGCTGSKCHAIAEALRQDTEKELLKAREMEKVHYTIDDTHATATFDDAALGATLVGGKYTLEFKNVSQDDFKIVMENKGENGAVKDRVIIDKISGFYEKYLLHTDGSMKDIPVGEPYNALFGWCVDKARAATPATPPAPQQ